MRTADSNCTAPFLSALPLLPHLRFCALMRAGGSPVANTRSNIVAAFRMVAGVAIPLGAVCAAVRVCKDGLITGEFTDWVKAAGTH